MIYTITLNPAIDRSVFVPEINYKDVTRVRETIRDAAGKGVNVARVLHSIEESVICLGFLGGNNGNFIRSELDAFGIQHHFVTVEQETRENIKICEDHSSVVLEFNELGKHVTTDEIQAFFSVLSHRLQVNDIVVLSGSIPQGVPTTIYSDIIRYCKEHDITTVLDASGELFRNSLQAAPTIIKPNRYELEQYFNTTLQSDESFIKAAKKLLEFGIDQIIVSMGKDGSIYVDSQKIYRVTAPAVEVVSSVGAGDSFVAGYSAGLQKGLSTVERLRLATSVAMASVRTSGTKPGSIEDINKYKKTIKIIEKV